MRHRNVVGTTAPSDRELKLRALLRIKDRREDRLRRQILLFTRQLQHTEDAHRQSQERHDMRKNALQQMLSWSGTLSVNELMMQKQKMSELCTEVHHLSQRLQMLAATQKRLQEKITQLRQERVSVMRKKEKLRSLLADEH